jgi:hypothetical protein
MRPIRRGPVSQNLTARTKKSLDGSTEWSESSPKLFGTKEWTLHDRQVSRPGGSRHTSDRPRKERPQTRVELAVTTRAEKE